MHYNSLDIFKVKVFKKFFRNSFEVTDTNDLQIVLLKIKHLI